ncbi:MAG: YceI family protein [bacterium]|jgi:polyisoprenoid-binding protein YceI
MSYKSITVPFALALTAIAGVSLGAAQAPQSAPASTTATAAGTTYKIDDVHSCALFRVHHLGAGQFWGRFNAVSGTMTFGESGQPTGFDVSIATDSVDTAEPKLDAHLKSPDFFNTKEFPAMTFKSDSVSKKSDGTLEVTGMLSMHGVTKSVTAALEVTGVKEMGMGARAGIEAVFTVKRSDFGMNYGVEKGTLGDQVRVVVSLEGIRG